MQQLTQTATKIQMKKLQDQVEVIILGHQGHQRVGLKRNLLPPIQSCKTTIAEDAAIILSRP